MQGNISAEICERYFQNVERSIYRGAPVPVWHYRIDRNIFIRIFPISNDDISLPYYESIFVF